MALCAGRRLCAPQTYVLSYLCKRGMHVCMYVSLHGARPPPPPHSPFFSTFPQPQPVFVSPPCWLLDLLGRCQGRVWIPCHLPPFCSMTLCVSGDVPTGAVCCVFVLPGPCCCLLCQATHLTASCALAPLGSPHGAGFSPALAVSGAHTVPSYACSGSGCDLLCGRWKVRGSCRTCQAVMARTVRTWVMCC